MLRASHHLPAAANIQRKKKYAFAFNRSQWFPWTNKQLKYFEKVHATTSLVFPASFKEFSWSTAHLLTHHCEQWTSCPPASSSRHSDYSKQKNLKECDVKESDSLSWCWLKLKLHMTLLTLWLIMHISHCLPVISSWSHKSLWGALQEVKKVVTAEQSSTLCGSQ